MHLSKRLSTIASLVPRGAKLADVGCDHGLLSISLLREGRIQRAFCMDINREPLKRAERNAREAGFPASGDSGEICFILSDGFRELTPGAADTAVIAGMGGDLMTRILSEADPLLLAGIKAFILSPQSETGRFRSFLLSAGYEIYEERMVLEEGKFYPVICARRAGEQTDRAFSPKNPADSYTAAELRYGRYLLQDKNPVLHQLLRKEKKETMQILSRKGIPEIRRGELIDKLSVIEEAIGCYEMQ
ncbi:MAG: class I SAM-dependent methyltransferase [Lachnospiraceae bacterium]|nr:class I SAM-dependent methyltransferase [Lachnospiraceae bacterium]